MRSRVKQMIGLVMVVLVNICVSSMVFGAVLSYTNGLDVWLDCENIDGMTNSTLSNGDAITNWLNKAGGVAGDAIPVGSRCGVFSAGAGPLHDAVTLNGSSDAMQFNEFMDSDTVSMFFVAKCTGGLNERKIFSDYGTPNSKVIGLTTTTGAAEARDEGSDVISAATGSQMFDNVFATGELILSKTGTVYTMEVGEVGNTVTGTNASYGSTTWEGTDSLPTIGRLSGATVHYFGGEICEVLIYDHALSASDRTTVENYLATKYSHPVLPYTTGLQVWLDSGDIDGQNNTTLSNGDSITNWVNKAGSMPGNAVPSGGSQCGTFSFGTGPKNEHSTVKLNGSSDAMQFNEFMDSDTVSMFFVAKCTGGSGERRIFSDYGSTSTKLIGLTTTNGAAGARDAGGNVISAATGSQMFDNVFATGELILSKTGTAYTIEVGEVGNTVTGNNASYGSTTWEGTTSLPTIGKLSGASVHYFGGEICEVLIYDNAIFGTNRTAIEEYLYNKYFAARGSVIVIK